MDALKNRVALVTGSSSGIGAEVARLFAQHGAHVAVHGRNAETVAHVRDAIAWEGGTAMGVVADVTRFAEIERMRCDVERQLGPIEVLVANAGGNPSLPRPVDEMSEDDWRAAVDANLTATFLTLRSVLPGMKQRRRGTIITISSSAARRPHAASPVAYAAAKAGIQILTQDVALQAGPFGVRANCIAPETILTERNRQRIPEPQQRTLAEQHPLKRLGTPDDVARAALYLASDEASWISGVVFDVAGGAVTV